MVNHFSNLVSGICDAESQGVFLSQEQTLEVNYEHKS
jgi:hypothetical protein